MKTFDRLMRVYREQRSFAGDTHFNIESRKRFSHAANVLESLIPLAKRESDYITANRERTYTNIDMVDYSAMKRRAELAETEVLRLKKQLALIENSL